MIAVAVVVGMVDVDKAVVCYVFMFWRYDDGMCLMVGAEMILYCTFVMRVLTCYW